MKRILWNTGRSMAYYALLFGIIMMPAMVSAQAANGNVGAKLTPARMESLAILIIGLVSVVVGLRTMKRAKAGLAEGNWEKGVIITLIAGLISVIFSGIHLARTSGGFGTGGGKAGAIAALLAGSVGISLGLLTIYRIRNNNKSN